MLHEPTIILRDSVAETFFRYDRINPYKNERKYQAMLFSLFAKNNSYKGETS